MDEKFKNEIDVLRAKMAVHNKAPWELGSSSDPEVQSMAEILADAQDGVSDWSKFITQLVVDRLGCELEDGGFAASCAEVTSGPELVVEEAEAE